MSGSRVQRQYKEGATQKVRVRGRVCIHVEERKSKIGENEESSIVSGEVVGECKNGYQHASDPTFALVTG